MIKSFLTADLVLEDSVRAAGEGRKETTPGHPDQSLNSGGGSLAVIRDVSAPHEGPGPAVHRRRETDPPSAGDLEGPVAEVGLA